MAFNATVLGLVQIRRGSYGEPVAAWQKFLQANGLPVGTADGDFGRATETATRTYQTTSKLPVTGVVDAATYQTALKQGFIFYVANLTAARLLQALNYGLDETIDLQKTLNETAGLKPALKLDGDFGANSTRALIQAYKQLEPTFLATLAQKLSDKTKKKLGTDFEPGLNILTEFSRRLRQRLSGPEWVKFRPASVSIDDLASPFRQRVRAFDKALRDAGAAIEINNTLRPLERVHLMHYSYKVFVKTLDPRDVPTFPGIEIDWMHYTVDLAVKAAEVMVRTYDIAYPPALRSNHTLGYAIDWYIEWKDTLKIQDANGKIVTITKPTNSFDNQQLWDVGATYGVYKLPSDAPHWSIDGY
ncbi:peptidoglycan-binding protein [Alkalinema sp. FACHB-956]|uniref:peptidoglycan-binding domain-containing protein n=1 Tax=Alkalinema sp. FACHB-956 TaxID=2692768 RepID=UPI0016897701|nr:peptidoglycan-binding protein [Alkalinema sp. FACHB-956]MBD2328189.1 peptidoglycan-binding protein [Alkalinema sp. FACHB-956]